MEAMRGQGRFELQEAGAALPGFWWLLAAMVLLCSSSMLLHESASWLLGYAPLWGGPVNVRAYSCDAHSIGLVFGYALTQISAPRFRRLVLDASCWLVFFLVQLVDVFVFYWLLGGAGPLFAVVIVQFVGAASGTVCFIACTQVVYRLEPGAFVGVVVAVVASTTGIVQGLFSILNASVPLFVSELLHLALVGASALCMLRALRPGSCFREAYAKADFLPICARETYAPAREESASRTGRDAASPDGVRSPSGRDAGGVSESGERRLQVPLYVRLFLIVGVYSATFGFLHVVPLALPLGAVTRVTSFLVGMALALLLFVATLRFTGSVNVERIWNRFYRFVFPLVVTAALLSPLTASSEFLPALIMQAWALYYFDALLAMACYAICRALHAAPFQMFGRAFLIRSVGFLVGNGIGSAVQEAVTLDAAAFSVIGAAVFALLCLVTFNMNSEKYAKTVWGLLPYENPRGRYERRRDEGCAELAARCGLTEREAEVLGLLAQGKRPKEISETLVVSVATVRSHVHAIYTKADVHSADELMARLREVERGA